MILYLLQTTSNSFVLELYDDNNTRTHWTNWKSNVQEALSSPLHRSRGKNSIESRIAQFNTVHKCIDGVTLSIHSIYTPDTHPEYFI